MPLRLLNVLRPPLVVAHRIGAQTDDLAVSFIELRLEAGHVAKLGCTHGSEIFRVGKQNRPTIANPLVKVNFAARSLRRKIRRNIVYSDSHCLFSFRRLLDMSRANAIESVRQYGTDSVI